MEPNPASTSEAAPKPKLTVQEQLDIIRQQILETEERMDGETDPHELGELQQDERDLVAEEERLEAELNARSVPYAEHELDGEEGDEE